MKKDDLYQLLDSFLRCLILNFFLVTFCLEVWINSS